MAIVTPQAQKNPYQAQKPQTAVQKPPAWADKFGEKFEASEEPAQAMAFDTTQASMDNHNAWNAWLQGGTQKVEATPEPTNGKKVEFTSFTAPRTPETSVIQEPEEISSPQEIKKSLHNAEVQSVLLAAEVLEDIKDLNAVNEAGFAARGELKFGPQDENTKMAFESSLGKEPEDALERYVLDTPTKLEEFKDGDLNLNRPQKLVDFGLFFTWVGKGTSEVASPVVKSIKQGFKSLFSSMFSLGKKEVFFGEKKQLTPEEKEKQVKQNANKVRFFGSLGNGRVMSSDSKRNLRQQVESTNKQAGFTNTSYEGSMDQGNQFRENVLNAAEKGNSQKSEEQLKMEKQRRLASMSKGKAKSGPGISFSSDKAHNFNNAAKLAG